MTMAYIPRNQLMNALHMLGLNPTYNGLEEIMREIDEDNDGRVSYDEFITFYERNKHTAYTKDALREAFRTFDTDGSGKLSREEFYNALLCGEQLTEEELEEIMRQADRDGTGEIDYEEFASFLCPDIVVDEPPNRDDERRAELMRDNAMRDMAQELLRDVAEVSTHKGTSSTLWDEIKKASEEIKVISVDEKDIRLIRKGKDEGELTAEERERNERAAKQLKELEMMIDNLKSQRSSVAARVRQCFDIHEERMRQWKHDERELSGKHSKEELRPIESKLEELRRVKRAILTGNQCPPFISTERESEMFLAGCAGDADSRGYHAAPEPKGLSERELLAFNMGKYLHHGHTSEYYGDRMMISEDLVRDLFGSNHDINDLLPETSLLAALEEEVGEENVKYVRAAFHDGINGKVLRADSLSDEWMDGAGSLDPSVKRAVETANQYALKVRDDTHGSSKADPDMRYPRELLRLRNNLSALDAQYEETIQELERKYNFIAGEEREFRCLDDQCLQGGQHIDHEWDAKMAEVRSELQKATKEDEERKRKQKEEEERKKREEE
eukprot:Sspe_Gene.4510::Locus_1485_Transcript_1_1_Confidence_1.000_Length_1864::g.4510::m.4510